MAVHFFLIVNLLFTAGVTAVLSYLYGNWRKQNKLVTIVHCISWWLPALILTTLPVDIATAFYANCTTSIPFAELQQQQQQSQRCRAPLLYADSHVLLIFWHTVYWSSQFLTWLLIPVMRSFSTAGDFTALAKLKTALVDNAVYYASYLGIFITALIYLVVKKAIKLDFGYLKVLLITAANTWGLFLVILFLGYGLVDVPRSLWIAGNPLTSLRRAYFRLSKRNMELADEEDKLADLVEQVEQLKTSLPLNHPLQPHLLIVAKQAKESQRSMQLPGPTAATRTGSSGTGHREDAAGLSLSQLARLHRSLKSTQHRRDRAEALYSEAVEHAIWLEDLNAFRSKHRQPVFAQLHSGRVTRALIRGAPRVGSVLARALSYWYCYARLWVIRALAVCLAVLSVLMVWSECTFFVRSPTLSVVAWLVKAEAARHDYFLLELSSFVTLGYLSFVVFYTVFRLRLFNFYRLVGGHHTDENSLLFCGALLCRLTPSLCLNFLGLAHLDSHIARTTLAVPQTLVQTVSSVISPIGAGGPAEPTGSVSSSVSPTAPVSADLSSGLETVYTRFMGHLDVIPFIARGFNIYFPILVVLLCVLTYLRFGDRVLRQLGVPELLSDSMTDTDRGLTTDSANSLVEDAIQDGRLLLRKERMMLSRMERVTASDDQARPSVELRRSSYSRQKDNNSKVKRTTNWTEDRVHLLGPVDQENDDEGGGNQEIDLLPPTSTPLIEYSEAEIESQFTLGRPAGIRR